MTTLKEITDAIEKHGIPREEWKAWETPAFIHVIAPYGAPGTPAQDLEKELTHMGLRFSRMLRHYILLKTPAERKSK